MKIKQLFEDKNRLLKAFLTTSSEYLEKFKLDAESELKLDWVDELSDLREVNVKALQLLDQEIDAEKRLLNRSSVDALQSEEGFRVTLEETLSLIKEIQLTDQSLFLYIQNMGFELRAQILKSLKEKEAVSKFKSQSQQTTGEGLDHTV